MLLCECARELQEPGAAKVIAATLEARDDLTGETAANPIRLDEDKCGFDSHAAEGSRGQRRSLRERDCTGWRISSTAKPEVEAGVAQYGQACQMASIGAPHELHA